ncbi:MAG: type I DNA topoisomerase [Lewinellaceae bacterium]|nr:type I DNA topoisomerase [Saprospiraceae bacterium]MCB9339892.1 type I DNA topoisomerase [Lewinellaceae bacterium]
MPKNLLIVESPAKAKTIEKFLGKDFTVKSSYGHVRDLPKGDISVDVENKFQPNYVVTPDKQKVVKELKDWVKKVDEVWLATDEDREGEAISWHLCEVLGLDEHTTKRIVFHEITKPAIQKAITQPRKLDLSLVNAQQARRILDRLVGYELSELLWKKVKGKLSAGRVQSVSVRLIVEREREIQAFESSPYFKITAEFLVKNQDGKNAILKADSPTRFEKEQEAQDFLKKCIGANFNIKNIEVKPGKRKPAAPFTTSTLQQEASRKLGFSVSRTMVVAQRLYEAGHITYMRTDSTNLSEMAIASIAQEVENLYGKNYVQTRRFKTKKAGAQEAHEAIRPTYIQNQQVTSERDQQRLYELIWKRTIASQMADAVLERTVVDIAISTQPGTNLVAEGEVLKFDGFLKVYLESSDDDDEEDTKGILPPLKVGQPLDLDKMTATERYTRPPARYTEASLVSKLEELGIGRPSTYAPTITKIMEENRGYVVKESREGEERKFAVLTLHKGNISKVENTEITGAVKNRLFPTDMGMVVTDFLVENFGDILDFSFTADIEEDFDEIAEGKLDWVKMVDSFYHPFHANVTKTLETSARATGEREIGTDPESGRTVIVRMTRHGKPVVQIGTKDELAEDEKPKFANLNPGQSIETINLEEALKLFTLPKTLGEHKGSEVTIGIGRYGPYVRHGDQFISIPKKEDPMEFTLEQAVQLIKEKEQADAPIGTYKGVPITKGKGRFGPFLKWDKLYVNVPKKYDFDKITVDEAHELIAAKIDKEANRYVQQWEKENIAIENGRWGPFIRFKKKNVSFPKQDGKKVTKEDAAEMTLEEVKAIIEAALPGSFKK